MILKLTEEDRLFLVTAIRGNTEPRSFAVEDRLLERLAVLPREATGPARHVLRTWPDQFRVLAAGIKTFEFRHDDRDFEVGDMLVLREWQPARKEFTGNELIRWVTYIVRGPDFGIPEGYCVMSISELRTEVKGSVTT